VTAPRPNAPSGEEGSGDRKALRTGECKAQKDDVAGHVGDEHVAENEVAERVHQAGHDGQCQEEWRKRAIRTARGRHQRLPSVGE
jgi:hypothetical protein